MGKPAHSLASTGSNMRVFALFLIGLALSAALIDHETKEEFKEFLKKYGKHYDNPVEFAKRLAIFAKNRAEQIKHNLKVIRQRWNG